MQTRCSAGPGPTELSVGKMDGVSEPAQRGTGKEQEDRGEGLGRAHTTLTSPGGCDKTGMEQFSGREIWPPANVNVLEELMHRTLICSSFARWRPV